jgi:hypothetical protein
MRLTLRTLLAYLDDTLEPEQAKRIGEKVAESDIAPELIDRIKKVTRRRGLAAPPVTGDEEDASSDPNTVAEYLDNTLSSEQLSEVEQSALDSDAHLAEISACHQILTLVLGEPAKVPPTARQRMYRLIKGRESIPYRKASIAKNVGIVDPDQIEENTEAEEALLLGMTSGRLLAPVAATLIAALLLVGVVWMAIPSPKAGSSPGYVAVAVGERPESKADGSHQETDNKEKRKNKELDKNDLVKKDPGKKDQESADGGEILKVAPRLVDAAPPIVVDPKPIVAPPEKPDPERKAVGKLDTKEMILLQREQDTETWERVAPGKEIFSADTLMSLPGNRCEVKLASGVRLSLWGSLPQFHTVPVLDILDSRVTLHVPRQGFDADLTLESGRVFIAAPVPMPAQPSKVRIRFKEEIWDVTLLDAATEVCIDLLGFYPEGVPFSKESGGPAPKAEFYFGLLKGKAELRIKFKVFPMLEAPTRVDWDSAVAAVGAPQKIKPADLEWWNKIVPDNDFAKQMQAAVTFFATRLSKPDAAKIEVIFFSAMDDAMEQPSRRAYAIYCLQALDAIGYLADAINDEFPVVRNIGIRAMEHWCGQAGDRDLKFYKVLVDKKSYTVPQATAVMQLTHPFSPQEQQKPEIVAALFDALRHEKVAVRELAYQHLIFLDATGAKEIGPFDVGAERSVLDPIVQKWKTSWKKRVIDQKK